jgi:hypothetical protein
LPEIHVEKLKGLRSISEKTFNGLSGHDASLGKRTETDRTAVVSKCDESTVELQRVPGGGRANVITRLVLCDGYEHPAGRSIGIELDKISVHAPFFETAIQLPAQIIGTGAAGHDSSPIERRKKLMGTDCHVQWRPAKHGAIIKDIKDGLPEANDGRRWHVLHISAG